MSNASKTISVDGGAEPHAEALYRPERVSDETCRPNDLSEEDVATCHDQGFLVVEEVMTRDQVDMAIDALNDLIALQVEGFSLEDLHVESGAASDSARSLRQRRQGCDMLIMHTEVYP